MVNQSEALVVLREAVFGDGEKAITAPVSLTLAPGDKVLLSGPSGCGKTSVLRGMLGFLSLHAGVFLLDGTPATVSAIWQWRQRVAYVPQELDLGRSCQVNAWLNESLGGVAEVHESDLHRVELGPAILTKSLDEISRGERQRLAILLALAQRREVVILDEVTSALNETLCNRVIDWFAQQEACVIAVSHDAAWQRHGSFRAVTFTNQPS